jgi:hypothetical protein
MWANIFDAITVTKTDQLALSLITILEMHNKTLDLIKVFVTREVAANEEFGTLFRSNSMASKLMKFYCKLIGQKYLQSLFVPLIRKLNGKGFEVTYRCAFLTLKG